MTIGREVRVRDLSTDRVRPGRTILAFREDAEGFWWGRGASELEACEDLWQRRREALTTLKGAAILGVPEQREGKVGARE